MFLPNFWPKVRINRGAPGFFEEYIPLNVKLVNCSINERIEMISVLESRTSIIDRAFIVSQAYMLLSEP